MTGTTSLHYCFPLDQLGELKKFREIVGHKGESKTIAKLIIDFVREHEGRPKEETPKNLMPALETLIGKAKEWDTYLSSLSIEELVRFQGLFKTGLDLTEKNWSEKKKPPKPKSRHQILAEIVGAGEEVAA